MKKKDNPAPDAKETPEVSPAEPETPEQDAAQEIDTELADLAKKLADTETQLAAMKDSYLRAQADFQNFKRRNQSAYTDGYTAGVTDTVKALLPMLDNLERAIAAATEESALLTGVKMTLTQFEDGLKQFGFEEVPALGEEFDPELHNAVMREKSDTPGKVIDVFQKGYRVKDRIIRYAMVKVGAEE